MNAALPNPFINSLSADTPPSVDQLTARDDCAAVLFFPESPEGDRQEAVASTGQASAAVSTSLSGLDHLTAAYVFGGIRAELAIAARELSDHVASRQFTDEPAQHHRNRVERQDGQDHLIGHLRSPLIRSDITAGINAHEQ